MEMPEAFNVSHRVCLKWCSEAIDENAASSYWPCTLLASCLFVFAECNSSQPNTIRSFGSLADHAASRTLSSSQNIVVKNAISILAAGACTISRIKSSHSRRSAFAWQIAQEYVTPCTSILGSGNQVSGNVNDLFKGVDMKMLSVKTVGRAAFERGISCMGSGKCGGFEMQRSRDALEYGLAGLATTPWTGLRRKWIGRTREERW